MMQVKLNQIARRAKQDKQLKFTSLIHHVNEANLAECYQELKANKACGIDGETVEAYGKNLKERLSQLVELMKSKQYRPKPVKRVYIPKTGRAVEKVYIAILYPKISVFINFLKKSVNILTWLKIKLFVKYIL